MIWSHMWRTRASVMLLSRVALTTPAIPHIACLLLFHTDTGHIGTGHSGTDRKGDRERIRLLPPSGRQIPETFEAIIAIVTRISLAATKCSVSFLPAAPPTRAARKLRKLSPITASFWVGSML